MENVRNTEGYSADMPDSNTDIVGDVSTKNSNESWTEEPQQDLPREMTVLQAENEENSESD